MSAVTRPVDQPADALRGHPAVDLVTAAAAVVAQEREVVGLEPLLLDALVSAPRAGLVLQLVTPPSSRLTVPLARVLRTTGGQWVVRRPDAGCFDGLTGRALVWDQTSFTDPPTGAELDPAWAQAPATERGSLVVELTTLHPAAAGLQLGEATETCCTGLGTGCPTGWGIAEPVSQPWDRAALTAFCRGRSPDAVTLVVVGGTPARSALGVVTVRPTTSGIREELVLQVGGGTAPELSRLDGAARALAEQPTPPRTALFGLAPGRDDGTVAAGPPGGVVPCGLLLGPAVVAEVGQERARSVPASEARLLGPTAAPSLWVHLVPGVGTADPGGTLGRVLRHLGVTLDGA